VCYYFALQRENLNKILLSQYLMKNEHCLSGEDVIQIQSSDPEIKKIIDRVKSTQLNYKNFKLENNVLYVTSLVMGQTINKLVIPQYLCSEILNKLHQNFEVHLSATKLVDIFNFNIRLQTSSFFWLNM
jgi:hypothetical protein